MPNFTKDRDNAILWARQIMERDFLVIDTETTGLGYDDEAVSIGLVDKAGEVLLDTLLCHTKRSDQGAEAVHGITWEMTREAPSFIDIYPKLRKLIEGQCVVAYNSGFDQRILSQTCRRYYQSEPSDFYNFQDVMTSFAEFYGDWSDYHGSYTWQKLTVAAQHFGLDTGNAHSAAADARLTLEIVKRMAEAKLFREVQNGPS